MGKSSLINKLCNRRKLARVSATPGKTATINFYKVDKAYFVDLPGYGYAKVSNAERERWDELINTYFEDDRTVIAHLQGFGCKILAYDLYQSDEVAQMAEYVPLDELYARSDVITLHTNATAENHHLINAESLAKMKDGVLIVNTARGALIDEEALIAALESGKVGGAGLDVVEEENDLVYFNRAGAALPHRTMNILRSMPNVIVSPHNAFYTDVNVASMVRSGFEELTDFAAGRSNPCEVPL